MSSHEGYEELEDCNREDCTGVIALLDIDGCCSCHSNPPCSYCTTPREYCPECAWNLQDEMNEVINPSFMELYPKPTEERIPSYMYTPRDTKYKGEDLTPIWGVNKYFDEVFDGVVARGLTKEEADKKLSRLTRNIYTSYGVVKNHKKY